MIIHSLRWVAQRSKTRLSLMSLSTRAFSAPSPMNLYRFFRVVSMSSHLTPYSCMRTISLLRTVVVLRMSEARIRSIVSTTVRPSFSNPKQSYEESSSKDSLPIFCMHSALISNNFYSFQKRFYVSLLSTRARQISLVALTITQRIVRTAQSMARCSSTSAPRRPCLSSIARRYFNAPKSMSSYTMAVSSYGKADVNEAAITFKAGSENAFLARMTCSMTSLPFMEWKTPRDWAISSEGLMRSMARQSSKLERYSCSSLLAGDRERYGLMDYRRTSTPQSLWNLSCAGREWERSSARTSLLTNLLSSMTLCDT